MVIVIGVDIGQVRDFSALVVAELEGDRFVIRHVERVRLGTAYPQVADRIRQVYEGAVEQIAPEVGRHHLLPPGQALEKAKESVFIRVDMTGVGRGIFDLVRERLGPVNLTGVSLTSGEKCSVGVRAKEGTCSKLYLVSRLQALIATGRIVLPETEEARALAQELLDFELRVTSDASLTFGAFRTGQHDDLVVALGLACLLDSDKYRPRVATTISRWAR